MACTAYVGFPGSGKTYEVVSEVIIPALRDGRRVVSNIRGLHYDEMKAYLQVDENIAPEAIGTLQLVDVADPGKEHFFFTEAHPDSVVRPGDLVVLDECWRWFAKGMNINAAMFEFFRMHRQFVDAKGVSCDIVLLSQAITDLDRKVLVVVEKHFRMQKYTALGSKKTYSVEMFEGYKTSNNKAIRVLSRKYNDKYFPFYSSYAAKGGDEKEVDKRFNIFRSPFFFLGMPVAGVFIIVGLIFATRYFTKIRPPLTVSGKEEKKVGGSGSAGDSSSGSLVSDWRSVGVLRVGSRLVFVVEQGGRYRYIVDAPEYRISGLDIKVPVDGKPATAYVGGAPGHGVLPATGAK